MFFNFQILWRSDLTFFTLQPLKVDWKFKFWIKKDVFVLFFFFKFVFGAFFPLLVAHWKWYLVFFPHFSSSDCSATLVFGKKKILLPNAQSCHWKKIQNSLGYGFFWLSRKYIMQGWLYFFGSFIDIFILYWY